MKTVLLAAGLLALAVPAWAGGEMTPEKKEICAEAEQRYKKLYPDAKDGKVVIVKTYKYTFCPPQVTVKVGSTVRWINVDKRTSHSVWLKESGVAESERFFPEETFEFTFLSPGTFPYLCGPHWKDDDMRGVVLVTP